MDVSATVITAIVSATAALVAAWVALRKDRRAAPLERDMGDVERADKAGRLALATAEQARMEADRANARADRMEARLGELEDALATSRTDAAMHRAAAEAARAELRSWIAGCRTCPVWPTRVEALPVDLREAVVVIEDET